MARDRLLSGAVISLLGGLLSVVPLFDAWEDIYREGQPPITTIIENSPLLMLGGVIVGAGVLLARSDWEAVYARRIAGLTVANATVVTILVGLVIGVQLGLQGRLKPVIIAADAVLIAAVGGIVIGIRSAEQKQALVAAETQRNRAQALFDNFTDAVALLSLGEDTSRVLSVNEEFEDVFGFRPADVEDIRERLVPDDELTESEAIGRRMLGGKPVRREVLRNTVDGQREFILQTVPVGETPDGTQEAYVVYIDISEQKEREYQLEFLNSLLRHDIQNGLTVIRSRAEFLAENLSGKEAEFARTIEERSDDLAGMTDRFRVMLDALTGDVSEDLTAVSLTSLVDDQTAKLVDTYPDLSLTTDVPDGLEVRADELLKNVLWNLLSNAVEHNETEDPAITVTAEERDEEVRIEIADNGPGIPDDLKDAIFRRSVSDVDNNVGSGFGLFFVDKMITRYGGEIQVQDNDPTGAVFVVSLPKA